MLVLAGLFVPGAWGFAGGGFTDMLLVMVSYVVLVYAGLTTLLWLTRRRHPRPDMGDGEGTDLFGTWTNREVEISTGRVRATLATMEVLLPIAAVAVSMVAFALVLHFAGHA
jgi:hypothetical protein